MAWLAVLGTAVATACVGVVAYIILKKKNQKDFTHRKLVEEYPADPGMLASGKFSISLLYDTSYVGKMPIWFRLNSKHQI